MSHERPNARALLREAGLSPKKSFGQNFLVSDHAIAAIARACIHDDEMARGTVVEFGAGLGALTAHLLERAFRVIAIERDRELVPILSRYFSSEVEAGKLSIVEGDAQAVDIRPYFEGDSHPLVLCGNLPYQITGRLLQRATEHVESIDRAVFMVQREVADRLAAKPSTKQYGALTVFTQAAFDVRRVLSVPPGAFHPPPDVTSAVVEFTPQKPRRAEETETFRKIVRGAFETRRKTLRNAWHRCADPNAIERAATASGISLDARGETLSVDEFAKMARLLDELAPSGR